MKDMKRDNHGDPIRGSLKPIEGTDFDRWTKKIIRSTGVAELTILQSSREHFKQIAALYVLHAARLVNKPVYITNESKNIFIGALSGYDRAVSYYANCCIKYINGEKNIPIQLNLNIPECGSLSINKAFKQAYKNAEKIITSRIDKIVMKMRKGDWSNISDELFIEYKGIGPAVKCVCYYVSSIVKDKLPSQITKDVYESAVDLESKSELKKGLKKIEKLYRLKSDSNVYQLKKNVKATYSSICQESATLIFCSTNRNIYPN